MTGRTGVPAYDDGARGQGGAIGKREPRDDIDIQCLADNTSRAGNAKKETIFWS